MNGKMAWISCLMYRSAFLITLLRVSKLERKGKLDS